MDFLSCHFIGIQEPNVSKISTPRLTVTTRPCERCLYNQQYYPQKHTAVTRQQLALLFLKRRSFRRICRACKVGVRYHCGEWYRSFKFPAAAVTQTVGLKWPEINEQEVFRSREKRANEGHEKRIHCETGRNNWRRCFHFSQYKSGSSLFIRNVASA